MLYRLFTRIYSFYISHFVLRGRCGSNCRFYPPIVIYDPSNLFIGDNVKIGPFVTIYAQGSVFIDDNVLIASNSVLTSTGHHLHPHLRESEVRSPIYISNNVWIGCSSTILPGVSIGSGSVIAGTSVVTKSVPEYSLLKQQQATTYSPIAFT